MRGTNEPPFRAGRRSDYWANPVRGHGHLITIEHNFPDDSGLEFYLDILLEYQYAPEVWKETSYRTWAVNPVPWFKHQITQSFGVATAYKSGIVLDTKSFGYPENNMVVKYLTSSTDVNTKILDMYLAIKPSAPIYAPGCGIGYAEGTRLDQYIGAAVVVWAIIFIGTEIAALLGLGIPGYILAGVLVGSMLMFVLQMSKETLSVYMDPDGYYYCVWNPGINSYSIAQLELTMIYQYSPQSPQIIWIKVGANEVWLTRPIPITISGWSESQIDSSVDEVYYGFYGRLPGEVIYG